MINLVDLVRDDYRALQRLDPGNELLKYWVDSGGLFKLNPGVNVAVEFLDRFGPPKTLKQECKSEQEYRAKLSLVSFGNYILALESTINFFTGKDISSSIN
jgi:hypothetical protein